MPLVSPQQHSEFMETFISFRYLYPSKTALKSFVIFSSIVSSTTIVFFLNGFSWFRKTLTLLSLFSITDISTLHIEKLFLDIFLMLPVTISASEKFSFFTSIRVLSEGRRYQSRQCLSINGPANSRTNESIRIKIEKTGPLLATSIDSKIIAKKRRASHA